MVVLDRTDDEGQRADRASQRVPMLNVAGKLVTDKLNDSEKDVFEDCENSPHDDCNLEDDGYDPADPDVAHFAKLPPEEMLATLERMIGASTDTDDRSTSQPSQEDMMARLQEECTAMRDEVQDQAKAKRDLESRLRQDMRKLQERCDSQLAEKASLTQRLQDARAVFDEKLEHMRSINTNLRLRIEEEKHAKERLRMELADNLQAMTDKVTLLNRRIQDDWENQVSLVQELDAETNSQCRFQSELHAEREKSWRQSHDVMEAFAASGKSPPPFALAVMEAPDFGHQPRLHNQVPFADESDQQHDALRLAIKSQEAKAVREKEEHTDIVKQLALEIWNKRSDTESLKKKTQMVENNVNLLLKRLEVENNANLLLSRLEEAKSTRSPRRVAPTSTAERSPSPVSPGSALGGGPDFVQALGRLDDLGRTMRDVETFKTELAELQRQNLDTWEQMENSKRADRQQIANLAEDLKKRQADKKAKIAELEKERKQEELLQSELQEIKAEKEHCEQVRELEARLREKTEEFNKIQSENENLTDELAIKQGCCMRGVKHSKPQQQARWQPGSDAQSSRQQPRQGAGASGDGGTPGLGVNVDKSGKSSSSREDPTMRSGGGVGQQRQRVDAADRGESRKNRKVDFGQDPAQASGRSDQAPGAVGQSSKASSSSSAGGPSAPRRSGRDELPRDSTKLTSKSAASSDRWPAGAIAPAGARSAQAPAGSSRSQPPVVAVDDL